MRLTGVVDAFEFFVERAARRDADQRRPYGWRVKDVQVFRDASTAGMWRWRADLEPNPEEK